MYLFAGRNLYCIDKNYGGALIIWDRLFGKCRPSVGQLHIMPLSFRNNDDYEGATNKIHHLTHPGTFAPETDKVVYGLVHPINTFEILTDRKSVV